MNQNSNPKKMDSLSLATISYLRPEDQRILSAVLSGWFQSPKDLNLTDPRMTYPFSMTKWIKLSYQEPGVTTLVCKKENWIIGHASFKPRLPEHYTLFHFIIDQQHRGQGIGTWFLDQILSLLKKQNAATVSLKVSRKNPAALQLYRSHGFQISGTSTSSFTMELALETGN